MSYLKQIRNTYTYLKEDKIAVSPKLYTDKKTFLRLRQDQLNIKYYCCLLHYFALQNSDTYYELKSTLYTDSGDIEKHKILMKRFTRFIEEELKGKGIFVVENDSNGNLHFHAHLVLPKRNIDQDLKAYRKAFQGRWEYLCDKLMIKVQRPFDQKEHDIKTLQGFYHDPTLPIDKYFDYIVKLWKLNQTYCPKCFGIIYITIGGVRHLPKEQYSRASTPKRRLRSLILAEHKFQSMLVQIDNLIDQRESYIMPELSKDSKKFGHYSEKTKHSKI